MTAYYNEIDPYCAQWLRNLIDAGHIAPGEVDERSIEDVKPDDLKTYTQSHFFAGIGVWSHSLRASGWEDSRRCWTGSCPCQPFSAAGKGAGFADERHLWPAWFHLIGELKPQYIFGEQVGGKNGLAWFDLVSADMEGLDYACGAVPAPASGFGAPHIRERIYWMAYADNAGPQGRDGGDLQERANQCASRASGSPSGVAYSNSEDKSGRRIQRPGESACEGEGSTCERSEGLCTTGDLGGVGDTESERRERRPNNGDEGRRQCSPGQAGASDNSRPTNGFWRDADWLLCTDGKWRPVEPGTFPLADGIANRVGRLRAYGNAIVAPQATEFIKAAMEYRP